MVPQTLKRVLRTILPDSVFGLLRVQRQQRSLRSYPRRTVSHNYSGLQLDVLIADETSKAFYDYDWGALSELDLMGDSRLKPGSTVFDIGAHQGVVAMLLADRVGPCGTVIACEANSHNASIARENLKRNAVDNVRVLEVAVAESVGKIEFNECLNGSVAGADRTWGRRVVPARSVDDLAVEFGTPDLIFIDVEGFEQLVLAGATKVLASKPDCLVEVHAGVGLERFGGSVDDVVGFFEDTGYQLLMGFDSGPSAAGNRDAGEAESKPYASGSNFVPFDRANPDLKGRFFLLAVHGVISS